MREVLSESKKQNHVLAERAQNRQRAQEDSELRAAELEKQTRALQEVRRGRAGGHLVHKHSTRRLKFILFILKPMQVVA